MAGEDKERGLPVEDAPTTIRKAVRRMASVDIKCPKCGARLRLCVNKAALTPGRAPGQTDDESLSSAALVDLTPYATQRHNEIAIDAGGPEGTKIHFSIEIKSDDFES